MGVYGHSEAANLAYLALYALQHRGQESSGIVSSRGDALISHRGLGLVADIFRPEIIQRLVGTAAIGHNRYGTHGETLLKNAQPLVVEYAGGALGVAHNGNLVDADQVRADLEATGSIFQSNSDTEVVIHLIAQARGERLVDKVITALSKVRGAYSMVFLSKTQLIAARDPMGFRPLVLGRVKDAWVVVSETCALDLMNAEYVREVEPGEILVISEGGLESTKPFPAAPHRRCVFEYVYFARPDSRVFDRTVYQVRRELGRQLARESHIDADLVTPVPDSGVPAGLGYAEEAGIPYQLMEGKRVVVVDDSLVRGTTSQKIVAMLRTAGAAEVHMRICSPPTISPCYYGIDTPTRAELVGSSHSVEEIREFIGADSLAYLSEEGLYAFQERGSERDFCDACFTARYPIAVAEAPEPRQLHLFDAFQAKV